MTNNFEEQKSAQQEALQLAHARMALVLAIRKPCPLRTCSTSCQSFPPQLRNLPSDGARPQFGRHWRILLVVRISRTGEVRRDQTELVEGGLQVLHNLGCKDCWVWEILRILKTLVAQPEDVEARLVSVDEVFVRERPEPVGLGSVMPILWVVAGDEIVQV